MTTGSDVPDFDLAAFLPYRLAVAAGRVSRGLARRYGQELGIGIPEWRVLAHLARGGAVSVRDVHARVDMDKPRVTRAAQRLGAMGLVAKGPDPMDGRLVALTLTPEGRAAMAQLIPMALDYQREVLAALGPAAEGLLAALDRLAEGPDDPDGGA